MSATAVELSILDKAAECAADPVKFAKVMFPWEESGPLSDSQGPRAWQLKILGVVGDHLRSERRFEPLQIAVSSGHGIGKSALVGMVINWALATCPDAKIVVTAGTGTQLATKTAPEVSKWFRLGFTGNWFDINATSIRHKDPRRQAGWRADFITWSDHNTDAFAGLHNKGKRIVLIFDEASAIGEMVWQVAEGALTDKDTEIIWFAFGNPTQNAGRFKDCFGRFKHRWITCQIDSREVEGTNKEQINKWIEDYGEDSDFVRVRVRGVFPRASSNQFIAQDVVDFSRRYVAEAWESFPKILGVDVARFGDDQTVIFMRQGRKATCLLKTRGLSTAQVTDRVAEFIERENVDAVVVDSDGIGAPVHDQLVARGYARKLNEFHGGFPASDTHAYYNRRAEVWGKMRDALRAGLEIPKDSELETDLTGPLYGFSNHSQVQLEKKDDMKKRGLSSPDMGDALAMTFAVQLMARPPHPAPHPVMEHGWMA